LLKRLVLVLIAKLKIFEPAHCTASALEMFFKAKSAYIYPSQTFKTSQFQCNQAAGRTQSNQSDGSGMHQH